MDLLSLRELQVTKQGLMGNKTCINNTNQKSNNRIREVLLQMASFLLGEAIDNRNSAHLTIRMTGGNRDNWEQRDDVHSKINVETIFIIKLKALSNHICVCLYTT